MKAGATSGDGAKGRLAGAAGAAGASASTDDAILRRLDAVIEAARSGEKLPHDLNFRGAHLCDRDLSGLRLAGIDLAGADLSRADLSGANLAGARLSGAILFGAKLDRAELLQADLREADLTQCSADHTGFGGAQLDGAVLFGGKFAGASFTRGSLTGADLRTSDLTGARFRDANLSRADLSRCTMKNADLEQADVRDTCFEGADLSGGILRGMLHGTTAKWVGAGIQNVDFCGAYLVRRHIMDQNYLHEFRTSSRLARWIYWIWWATSDCGRSFVRWGLLTLSIGLAYAVLYQGVALRGTDSHDLMTTIYFSFVTLTTLGYGDIVPQSAGGRWLVLSE